MTTPPKLLTLREGARRGPSPGRPTRFGLNFQSEMREAVRGMTATTAGVGGAQGWVRDDALRGRLPLGRPMERLIDTAIDAGAPAEDVLPVAWAAETYIWARCLDRDGVVLQLVPTYQRETLAEGRANAAQLAVIARDDDRALLRAVIRWLCRHRAETTLAIAASALRLLEVER